MGAQFTLYVNSMVTPGAIGCGFSDVRFTWMICSSATSLPHRVASDMLRDLSELCLLSIEAREGHSILYPCPSANHS